LKTAHPHPQNQLHHLPSHQLGEQPLLRSQFLKTALLHEPTGFEYINAVSIADCTQPMGNYYPGNLLLI
jgi:hypothetical protein